MATKDREKTKSVYTPQEVRNLLKIDNKEIVSLCKKVSITPKKNTKGQTYFLPDEVEKLKSAQNEENNMEEVSTSKEIKPIENISRNMTLMSKADSDMFVHNVLNKLQSMEQLITDKVSTVIDEKLDGMDEVVVELIRCKTENETLRQKLNELNKQNYYLKNEVNSYKSMGLGLYIKKNVDDFSL